MGIAIDDVGRELEIVARDVLAKHDVRRSARELLEADVATLPPFWEHIAELGWLGLHVDEHYGGQGAGLAELAVVVEQMGRCVAPGPFLPTVLASAVIATAGSESQRHALLPGLVDGTRTAAVGFGGSLDRSADGVVHGDGGLVLGAALADVLLLPVGDDLFVADRDDVIVTERRNFDPTRRVAAVTCDSVATDDDRVLRDARRVAVRIGRALAAAEAAGVARACTDMATAYARQREQFGRIIGSFQAVKHHCANMLVETEVATAAAWDAARVATRSTRDAELASAVAAALALPAAVRSAKLCLQVHGGIGYTWEHDAHLYVRRAQALAAVFGPVAAAHDDVARLAVSLPRPHAELPPEAAAIRREVQAFAERVRATPESGRPALMIDEGYAMPHWPAPWGRDAVAAEQLVIDEVLDEFRLPSMGIGEWITLTLATYGTPSQTQRWVRQSLTGDITWCQLFSEPNAGSDAAGIQTRAVRTDGGWLITGQKVWTTGADRVSHGLASVRTDPDAPKHAGITMMVITMSAPGVEVRPLRDISGDAVFNEVFLDDVFVPDADVVGDVDGGWAIARATLGNERLTIGANLGHVGADATELLPLVAARCPDDAEHTRALGRLIAQNHALALLNVRRVARALTGSAPGPEATITKLLTAEHAQAVHELALVLYGADASLRDGPAADRIESFLFSRQATIAGGTSEISRNQIGERLLGLPREPALR